MIDINVFGLLGDALASDLRFSISGYGVLTVYESKLIWQQTHILSLISRSMSCLPCLATFPRNFSIGLLLRAAHRMRGCRKPQFVSIHPPPHGGCIPVSPLPQRGRCGTAGGGVHFFGAQGRGTKHLMCIFHCTQKKFQVFCSLLSRPVCVQSKEYFNDIFYLQLHCGCLEPSCL